MFIKVKMKKIIIIVLMIFLVFSKTKVVIYSETMLLEKLEKQASLLQKYSNFMKESKNNVNFNHEFGGAYFSANGDLVINVVRGTTKNFTETKLLSDSFEIKEVDYSLSEINDNIKIVESLMAKGIVKSVGRSEQENTIIVTLYNKNDENMNIINSLTSLNNIIFLEQSKNIQNELTVKYAHPGDQATIFRYGTWVDFTIGFAARDANGDDGFVTAGHGGIQVGNDVRCDNVYLMCGDVRIISYHNNSYSDASFVELRDSWISNWLPSYNFMTGTDYYTNVIYDTNTLEATLVENMIVTAFGDVSGKQTGVVLETYYSDTVDGKYLIGFVKADYETNFGDSGAAVTTWKYNPSYGYSTLQALGIQSYTGFVNGEWDDNLSYSCFSKADKIFEDLDLSPY